MKERCDLITLRLIRVSDEQWRRFLQTSTEGCKRTVCTLLRNTASSKLLLCLPLWTDCVAWPCFQRSSSSAWPAWPASQGVHHFQTIVSQAMAKSWNDTKLFCTVSVFVRAVRWGKGDWSCPSSEQPSSSHRSCLKENLSAHQLSLMPLQSHTPKYLSRP